MACLMRGFQRRVHFRKTTGYTLIIAYKRSFKVHARSLGDVSGNTSNLTNEYMKCDAVITW